MAANAALEIHPLTLRCMHAFLCNIGDISHASSAKCSIVYNPDETAYRPQGTTLIPFVIRSPTYAISGSCLSLTFNSFHDANRTNETLDSLHSCASRNKTSDLQAASSKSYLHFVSTNIQDSGHMHAPRDIRRTL